MKSKSVDEVLKERSNDDYKKSVSYLCKTLLTRNEELEKCVRELVEVTKTLQQYLNVFILRGEEPLLGENSKTDSYNTITTLSNAKKLLNNE